MTFPRRGRDDAAEDERPASRSRLLRRGLTACALAGLIVAGLAIPPAVAGGMLLRDATALVGPAGADRTNGETGALTGGTLRQASVVTDAAGTPIATLYERYRIPVGADAIAATMKAATLAIEDRRFFEHNGVDWYGLSRALVSNAATGSPLEGQGASTITMQYVKNYRLHALARTAEEEDAATEQTIARKLVEVQLAPQVEAALSKDEILSRYLDLVYFGNGAYGIEAAARTYFGTSASALTIPQAALLAGILRAPSLYDPVSRPENALARRGDVLRAMQDTRTITPEQATAAAAAPLGILEPLQRPAPGCEGATSGTGFFCDYVQDYLAGAGISAADLRTGGYTVRTTLDPRVQAQVSQAAAAVPTGTGVANVSAVVGPSDARPVLGLAANRTYGGDADDGQSSLPLTTAPLRGAGSVYKIFTAAAGLQRGVISPGDTFDVPQSYDSTLSDGYTVRNYDGEGGGTTNLQGALANSPNTPFVALTDRIGSVEPIVDAARGLGLRASLDAPGAGGATVGENVVDQEQASFTLGPTGTSPLELANVGASLVEGGRWCPPTPVTSVTDATGAPVDIPRPACEQGVSPEVAGQLRTALSAGAVDGTAAGAASSAGWDRPVIAKTGTTQDSASAAFLGATTAFAGAVMTFSDQGAPRPVCLSPVRACSSGSLTGGSVPAQTWFDAMTPLHQGIAEGPLVPPTSTSGDSGDSDSDSGDGDDGGSDDGDDGGDDGDGD